MAPLAQLNWAAHCSGHESLLHPVCICVCFTARLLSIAIEMTYMRAPITNTRYNSRLSPNIIPSTLPACQLLKKGHSRGTPPHSLHFTHVPIAIEITHAKRLTLSPLLYPCANRYRNNTHQASCVIPSTLPTWHSLKR